MRIILRNSVSLVVVGGADNLLPYNLMDTLREYFSVKVKGAFFAQKRSKFAWDGRKYYLTEGGKLPTGFIPYLFEYLEDTDIPVDVVDERVNLIRFKPVFNDNIGDITLRTYQIPAVKALNNHITFRGQSYYFPSGVWDMATNSGKTLAASFLYHNLEGCYMLITINRVDVFKQLVKEFGQQGDDIGVITSSRVDLKPITVAMAGTLYNKMKSVAFRKSMHVFNTLVVDEGHTAGGKQYSWVIKNLDHIGVRLIMSGTPMDQADETKALTVTGLGGKVLYKVTKKELMDMGVSKRALVKIHYCDSNLFWGEGYDKSYDAGVKFSQERLDEMFGIIQDNPNRSILISVYYKDHLEFLYEGLKSLPMVEAVHGEDPQRADKLERFRLGDTHVLISTEITTLGLNMPLINILIMAQGEKSKIALKQWSGRAERACEGEDSFELHDFYDVGQYIEEHSKKRIRVYREEGFDIEYDYVATPTGMSKKK